MEFLYYLEDPENMLKLFYRDWLQKGGWAVIGIDQCRKRGKFKLARICWCGNGHADHRPPPRGKMPVSLTFNIGLLVEKMA